MVEARAEETRFNSGLLLLPRTQRRPQGAARQTTRGLDRKENYYLDLAAEQGWPKAKLRGKD